MIVSGNARVAGVLGWPVSHSLSPRLHGYWLAQHGIDGAYVPLAVRPEVLVSALRALADLGFCGANVTLPHKEAALTACDDVDALARRIGAVNTVIIEDGRLKGFNTDAYGFLESLAQGAASLDLKAAPAVVLGAGGAARAVVAALLEAGVPELRLVNRTRSRADSLAATLGGPIRVVSWAKSADALEGAGLLVNTTVLGMADKPPLVLDLDALRPKAVVTDIVYTPLETPLLAQARGRGHPAVDGLGMLLHQAVPGFEAWFGLRPRVDQALRDFILKG